MHGTTVAGLAMTAILAAGCPRNGGPDAPVPSGEAEASAPAAPAGDPVGVATMDEDGVLSLQLRAEGPDGTLGDALFVYPPDHPEYDEILEHLGGLEPGQSKPVPPWPDP